MALYPRIGIDLDGVLIDHREHKLKLAAEYGVVLEPWQANTNVLGKFVKEEVLEAIQEPLYTTLTPTAPPVAGALEHLARIKTEIYIISARRSESVRYAQDWLLKHRVYDAVPAERIYFCGGDDEKRGYCDRLGLSLFLDDRVRVLELLPGKTKRVLYDEDEVAKYLQVEERMHVAKTWEDFRKLVSGEK